MMNIKANLEQLKERIPEHVELVAVSKTKPAHMVRELFEAGHLDFGENKVQELVEKQQELPGEIRWHMIGHLQSNKVKYIAPFVHLVHGVDSLKLLRVLDKEGRKNERQINCLLQMHIAKETAKFGLSEEELETILASEEFRKMEFVKVRGLMGMATFTDNSEVVREEFRNLKRIFEKLKSVHFRSQPGFSVLSMGMSDDYQLAIEEGSNMIRVGSLVFGPRETT
ncbi:MAG: YggS family pyridoxal phosphate-dependent enzyme [Bacteroidales bacterium]|nr:YggS family pyridoxal phosphate-dependent enzyme [Bacteroidales bacterium]MDT8430049.1 YggS family pyridoxal phosphate-dependent enzyme [Bacteroidales bacterium]